MVEFFSCLLDQMRWQPWEYQFLLTFLFFVVYQKKHENFIKTIAILIIATYVFSGIHKINPAFLHNIWDRMMLQKAFHFSAATTSNRTIHFFGLIIPTIEILIGFGLFFKKKRFFFVTLSIAMHIFIIVLLGKILNQNHVVLPWNVAMICLVFIVFKSQEFDFKPEFKTQKIAAIILLICLPILNFFGHWDSYLSYKLYAGDNQKLMLYAEVQQNIDGIKIYKNSNPNYQIQNTTTIDVEKIAFAELNVPIVPEARIYRQIAISINKKWNQNYKYYLFQSPYKFNNKKELKIEPFFFQNN